MENEDPDFQAPRSKRPKKNTSVDTKTRFGSPLKDGEMKTVVKGHVPVNIQRNTLWALNCFHKWMIVRNERAWRDGNEDSCPEDLLDNADTQNLNKWIPHFVTEVRNQKGEPYPPRSIILLLSGLQRHMLEKTPGSPKFLNKSDPTFRGINLTIDCCKDVLFYYNFCAREIYIFPS